MRKGRKLATRYPWKDWFAKVKFTLWRGQDYAVQPYVMGQMVRNRAYALGLKPHINVYESGRIDVILEERA